MADNKVIGRDGRPLKFEGRSVAEWTDEEVRAGMVPYDADPDVRYVPSRFWRFLRREVNRDAG